MPLSQAFFQSPRFAVGLLLGAGLAALAGCQVRPPETLTDIARATGVDHAIVFRHEAEPLDETALAGTLMPEAAVRMALAHDPRIQAALAAVRVAEADANQARLLPNPILNIDIRVPHSAGSNTAFEATLTGDLVSLLQKPAEISAADKRLRAASQDALTTALDVMSEVQEAYAAAQADEALVDSAQKRGEILGQLRGIAQKRLEVGEGARLDVLTFQSQQALADLDLADARRQRFEDRLNLAKLIGQPRSAADWPLAAWAPPVDATPAPEAAWIAAALKTRPEIHAKLYELQALGDDLTAAAFSPFIGGDVGPHTERDPEWRTGPSITIPVPIFDFGQASRAKILAQRVAVRHELAGLEADIIQEIRLAFANDQYARAALVSARQTLLPLQLQQVELAGRAYQIGNTDFATLLLAETDLQATQLKIIQIQQSAVVARVKLQRAAGGAAVAAMLEAPPATGPSTAPATAPATALAAPPVAAPPLSQPATGITQ